MSNLADGDRDAYALLTARRSGSEWLEGGYGFCLTLLVIAVPGAEIDEVMGAVRLAPGDVQEVVGYELSPTRRTAEPGADAAPTLAATPDRAKASARWGPVVQSAALGRPAHQPTAGNG